MVYLLCCPDRSSRPDVKFFCDINYDPFVYMREHDKVYSESTSAMACEEFLIV